MDALLQAATYAGLEQQGRGIEFLRKVVAIGEKNLGKDFKEFAGHFWGFIETRPYMRARERLAQAFVTMVGWTRPSWNGTRCWS